MSRYNRGGRGRPENAWENKLQKTNGHRIPPHLKGKQIGLYFRDRQKLKRDFKKNTPKEFVLTFGIPSTIEKRVCTNLETITKLATKLNIPIPSIQTSLLPKNKTEYSNDDTEVVSLEDTVMAGKDKFNITWAPNVSKDLKDSLDMSTDSVGDDHVFAKPQPYQNYQDSKPGSSSTPDFIPIGRDDPNNYTDLNFLPLIGKGDYKYGYTDIITGTFDEKLNESLSKGCNIKSRNEDMNIAVFKEYLEMKMRSQYKKMLKFREMLPAYKKGPDLLKVINENQVVVISGETGCGKSTQVPQIILDNAIENEKGAHVHIVVTQPRRIAASSLATRVAAERAEPMGNSVGYAVRLEKVDARPRASIMFYTTGVLLAELEIEQALGNYSHVILDEVHERDCQVDMTMCMVKKVLQKRKDLKLILMSATLDAEKLSEYFDNCPMVHIEGLAYPVEDIYLEDILLMTNYELPPDKKKNNVPFNMPVWKKHTARGKWMAQRDEKKMESEIKYRAEIDKHLTDLVRRRPEVRHIRHTLLDPRIEEMNVDLIFELIIHICKGPPGAILVFLPGIGDITKLLKRLNESGYFPHSNYEIYPLHSKLPSLEQHRIFEKPPEHIRKIIVATNIAETSITIDDIVYVIDCGKIKYKGLNIEDNISTLKTEWVSQANLRQRRGRAGRCQPGICYHLLTSYRAGLLDERLLPELQRNDLLEPVLTIKKLRLGKAKDAMAMMPSPPAVSTVEWAVKHLQLCGALNDSETLTPLGWHLARLPVHPAAGKLLLLGSLFGCLDRAASLAAVWGFKDPFQLVIGKEREVDEMKRRLAYGEPSDHVAISEAIIQWEQMPHSKRSAFAYEHFLSNSTLALLSEMKQQFGDSLKQMGFLPSGNICADWENRNAGNISLFKAIVAAALYPNVATAKWNNMRSKKGKQPRVKAYLPSGRQPTAIHPSSVMSAGQAPGSEFISVCDNPGASWLVYWLKQRSTDLYLIEVTLVHTLPILFFGDLSVKAEEEGDDQETCIISTCGVKVRCNRKTTSIVFQLRSLLDVVLASKVMTSGDQSRIQCDFEECVLNAVAELITAEDERSVHFDDDEESDTSDTTPVRPIETPSYISLYNK